MSRDERGTNDGEKAAYYLRKGEEAIFGRSEVLGAIFPDICPIADLVCDIHEGRKPKPRPVRKGRQDKTIPNNNDNGTMGGYSVHG